MRTVRAIAWIAPVSLLVVDLPVGRSPTGRRRVSRLCGPAYQARDPLPLNPAPPHTRTCVRDPADVPEWTHPRRGRGPGGLARLWLPRSAPRRPPHVDLPAVPGARRAGRADHDLRHVPRSRARSRSRAAWPRAHQPKLGGSVGLSLQPLRELGTRGRRASSRWAASGPHSTTTATALGRGKKPPLFTYLAPLRTPGPRPLGLAASSARPSSRASGPVGP